MDVDALKNVSMWLDSFGMYAKSDICVVLVGTNTKNHQDERMVSFEEAKALAACYEVPYFEACLFDYEAVANVLE